MPAVADTPAVEAVLAETTAALERVTRLLERDVRAREELAHLERDRQLDLIRTAPKPLGWAMLLRAVPGLAGQLRPIPDEYARSERDGAEVKCPCGAYPFVRRDQSEQCQCGRIYLNAGSIFVANSPPASSTANVD